MNDIRQTEQIQRIAVAIRTFGLASLIVVALLLSAARLTLPLIDNYHHHLAELLSQQLGYRVNFNGLSLRLAGWQPRLRFADLQLIKPDATTPVFAAQALELDLNLLGSWRSHAPEFNHFTLISAQLTLRRNAAGQLALLGFEALPLAHPAALARFLDQGQINLLDSSIRFIDERRPNAAPLQLSAVKMQLHNAGWQHQLNLSACIGEKSPTSLLLRKKSPPPPLLQRGEEEKPPFFRKEHEKPPFEKGGLGGFDPTKQLGEFSATAEFSGAPTAVSTWDGTAHLHLKGDNLAKMLPPEWLAGAELNSGALQLDSWLRIQAGGFEQALVHINAVDLKVAQISPAREKSPPPPLLLRGEEEKPPFNTGHEKPSLEKDTLEKPPLEKGGLGGFNLQAQTRIRRQPAGGWQIEIADLNAASLAGVNLNLLLDADGSMSRLDVIAKQMQLADLTALLRSSPWQLPAAIAPLLAAQPHGRISALNILADRSDTAQPWRWNATATLAAGGIVPTAAAPGIDGLEGQLTADHNGGSLQLHSAQFTLNAPQQFRAPLAFNALRGQLDWFRAPTGDWQLVGREFTVANQDFNGEFQFEMTLPADRASPLLKLRGQLHDAQVAQVPAYLPMNKLPPPLLAWLDRSLQGGRITHAEVNFAGRLADYPFRDQSGQFELRIAFTDLALAYHPDWPALTQASGEMQFHRQALEIAVERGRIYDSEFLHGAVHIPEPHGLQHLVIHGEVAGPLTDGLRVLRSTPLAAKLGSIAEKLTVSGSSRLALEIDLPLVKSLPLGVTGQLTWPRAATLSLNHTPIHLSALGGTLHFTENSVRGEALTAQLWGQPLRLTLATEGDAAARRLHLRAQSKTPVAELARQIPSPLWAAVSGAAAWDLTATLPPPGTTPLAIDYQLSSNLKGLAIHLPAPLGKTAPAARALAVQGTLIPQQTLTLAGQVGEVDTRLALGLDAGGVRLTGGHLRLGKNAPPVPRQPGLWLLAQMKDINLNEWLNALQPFATKEKAKPPRAPVELPLGVNVRCDRLRLGDDLSLHAVTLKRDPAQPAGDISVKADELAGRVRLASGANRPLTLALERLDLRPLLTAITDRPPARTAGRVAKRSPQLPSVEVQVANLRWGDTALGRLTLGLRSSATGQQLSELRLDGNSLLALHGTGDWQRTDDRDGHTQLHLIVDSSNLGALLQTLGEPAAVEAGASRAELQLQWRGGFNAFLWAQAQGLIDLEIGSGRLPKVEPGLGRLLGVVNLAALNRRLTLDFSDLYGQGFAFERIHGRLNVNAGQARMSGFTIDGPAGRVLIEGLTDLIAHRFEQTVTVEPKLGSGIALAGAVAGGPIVGAVVYLVNQVAGNPFDRLVRYRYRVTGPWREPEFQRIGWESLLNTRKQNAPAPTDHFMDNR